jgi:hypothetical protein
LVINYLCLGILQNILTKASIFSEKEV